MEVLIKSRAITLVIFILTLFAAIIFSYKELQILYLATAFICHIFFFLMFITESFGRISKQRHIAWRFTAKVILLLTGLTIINITFYFIIAIFS
jgi:hypothetical protein